MSARRVYLPDVEHIGEGVPFKVFSKGECVGKVSLGLAACAIQCLIHGVKVRFCVEYALVRGCACKCSGFETPVLSVFVLRAKPLEIHSIAVFLHPFDGCDTKVEFHSLLVVSARGVARNWSPKSCSRGLLASPMRIVTLSKFSCKDSIMVLSCY
jgi:hypothetical protein